MRIVKITLQIILLYIIYSVGVWIQQALNLFIPGSIIGMLILYSLLLSKVIHKEWIEKGNKFLIHHLALLFLPVTVGIINFLNLFKGKGFLIIIIVLVSTIFVMAGTGLISQKLAYRKVREHE